MTPQELAYQIEPEVQTLCQNMIPTIKKAVGTLKWLAILGTFGVTWKVLTSHSVLPIIIQHGLEYGIAKTQNYVHPMINVVKSAIPLLESFVTDPKYLAEIKEYLSNLESLYSVSVSQLLEGVQATVQGNITSEARQMEFQFSSF